MPLFQAAFSFAAMAAAPPNSSKFKDDAGTFYCESQTNRESCHRQVFPFQRQMNALLPRDQATLPRAGSFFGPLLVPLGKLEATLLETSGNRVISIMRLWQV